MNRFEPGYATFEKALSYLEKYAEENSLKKVNDYGKYVTYDKDGITYVMYEKNRCAILCVNDADSQPFCLFVVPSDYSLFKLKLL